ncbi:MAG: DUF1178 family protein [Rhodospirillales bacterium]
MIKYDVKCDQGHVFEGWFPNSDGFEAQRAQGEVACPVCGSQSVEKAVMAPRLPAKGNAKAQRMAEIRRELQDLRQTVETNCDYVGPRFAEEARKIHYGETEARGIYGETTKDDAKALSEEGVTFAQVPWIPKENA